ncbi:MAG TPA: hypothetical protein VJ732_07465 [Bryobacteraceae bacterium]|nr:hypothetical protein [Bryobacteraceae bacterium]
MSKIQFRVLYREFLFRVVDLELLAPQGDTNKLLGQFAGLLIFCSLWLSAIATIAAGPGRGNRLLDMLYHWMAQHFLIATTMLAVGLFAVMSWESMFPDRRDVLILSPLPVRARTTLFAKAAAVATALSITVSALNGFTGLVLPWGFASQGATHVMRAFGAWWATQFAAGLFMFCSVLTVQGMAQLLRRQAYLRVSSWLQTALFILILTVYFLQPPFSEVQDLLANESALRWIPSYWFFGLFHQLSGSILAPPAFLAARAWMGLGAALCGAIAAYLIANFRTLPMLAEQPDILPARRGLGRLPRFGDSLQTAVVQFSVCTLLRSRHHRVVLTFYLGLGLGLAIFISHMPEVYLRASGFGEWYRQNAPLLMASTLILCAAVLGTRVVFSLPLEVRANWIFRMMPQAGVRRCLAASRRSLYVLAVAPVWMSSAALFFYLWPWRVAAEHLILLGALASAVAELSIHGFHKIPFTCSYLPGKTRFNMALVYLWLFLLVTEWAADREIAALSRPDLYVCTLCILVTLALLARWRSGAAAQSEGEQVQFEETPEPAVLALDLHRDGVTTIRSPGESERCSRISSGRGGWAQPPAGR